jgi:surface antigen
MHYVLNVIDRLIIIRPAGSKMFKIFGTSLLKDTGKTRVMLGIVSLLLPVWGCSDAFADPPSWAPANGYRHHHEQDDEDSYQDEDRTPRREIAETPDIPLYGIDRGTCDRELIGQILGGAAGAAVGSTIGQGNDNTAAIIGGAIIGMVVGGNIGRSMDRVDQGCVGQILEHAPNGRMVAWESENGRARYQVTPDRSFRDNRGRNCRNYLTESVVNGSNRRTYSTACRESNGAWKMVQN